MENGLRWCQGCATGVGSRVVLVVPGHQVTSEELDDRGPVRPWGYVLLGLVCSSVATFI
jgi:hypothetical protein